MNYFILVLIIIVLIQSVIMAFILTRKTKSEEQIKEEIKNADIKITKDQIKQAIIKPRKKKVDPFNVMNGGV